MSNSGTKHYELETPAKTGDSTTDLPIGAVYDTFTVTKSDAGEKYVTEAGVTPPLIEEPEAPAGAEIALGAASVAAGGKVTISGTGFAADASLRVELRSDPVDLGTITADADGAFSRTLTIPASTAVGVHTLAVILADGTEVTSQLTVTAAAGGGAVAPGTGGSGSASDGALAITGADSTPFIVGAVVLLALGLVPVALRRRRRSVETVTTVSAE